jgi:flagellar hook-basal body complex protein FliE
MSASEINQVLAQMRLMAAQASNTAPKTEPAGQNEFAELLKNSIDGVNETQQHAAQMKTAFELGEDNVELAEVMVAVQKSSVSFEAMVQVRNKLVEAYKDVMNMPI